MKKNLFLAIILLCSQSFAKDCKVFVRALGTPGHITTVKQHAEKLLHKRGHLLVDTLDSNTTHFLSLGEAIFDYEHNEQPSTLSRDSGYSAILVEIDPKVFETIPLPYNPRDFGVVTMDVATVGQTIGSYDLPATVIKRKMNAALPACSSH